VDIDPEWARLADLVVERRRELGHMTTSAFAEASGLSRRLLGDIERTARDNYDQVTLAQLEVALGWAKGSIQEVLAGGEPTEADAAGELQAPGVRRLALAVVRRREALGLSLAELANRSGLTVRTLSAVEKAQVILKPKARSALGAALGWSDEDVVTIMRTPELAPDSYGLPAPEYRPSTPTPFGRFVLACMREAGFTTARAVAAAAAEVTPAAVTHLLYGTKDVDRTVVGRVAKALGVPLEEFLVRLEPDFYELPLGRPLHPLAVEASDMLDPGSPLDDADRDFLVRMLDLLLERMRLKMATRHDDL
jgi:transcriptional regulator with XRE-family HTH domain